MESSLIKAIFFILNLNLNVVFAEDIKLDHLVSDLINAESSLELKPNSLKQENSVWVLFQNGCQSCHKMMKEYNCYTKKKINPYFLGILSKPNSLLKEARNHGYKGDVYYSNTSLKDKLDLSVTPTVFIFKKEKFLKRIDNYISCKDITKLFLK